MSVIAMEKLTVVSTKEHADAIVRRLMRLRAVSLRESDDAESAQVSDTFAPETDTAALTAQIARIETAHAALARYSRRRKRLLGGQIPISPDAFQTDGRRDTAWKVVDETNKILAGLAKAEETQNELAVQIKALQPYEALPFPLDYTGTPTTAYLTGSFPGGTRPERITRALEGMAAELFVLSTDATGIYVSLLTHRGEEETVLRTLSGLGFLRSPLPASEKTVRTLLSEARVAQKQVADEAERLKARLSVLADKLDAVEILIDVERTSLLAEENKKALAATDQCVILRGWCPVTEKERVAAALTPFCAAYSFEPPAEGDEPPILLKNNGFAKNFECQRA